ncbi:MAG: DUF2752 domain-containing protein [Phycisphaerae bacterium]|nr:DUF2752 domain-containing protein [Phycisphaerae bacterium]
MTIVGVWLAMVIAVEILGRASGQHILLCPMKHLAGIPCPTCGSTRAGLAMLAGDPVRAWLWNPLVVSITAVACVVMGIRLATGWTLRLNFTQREWRIATALLILAVLANWTYLLYIGA